MPSLVSGRGRGRLGLVLLLLSSLTLLTTTGAHAATDEEKAAARSLAKQGLAAFKDGNAEGAVDYFSRAEALVHSPVHLLFLARAYAQLGRLVKAQEAYIKIGREPADPRSPKAFRQAKADAEKELAGIEPRLSHLTVRVVNEAGGEVSVLLDDEVVPSVLLGVPMPVDPGKHALRATAERAREASGSVTLAEGEDGRIELRLDPLPMAEEDGAAADSDAVSPLMTTQSEAGSAWQTYAGWTGVGLGGVGLGVAGYFLFTSRQTVSEYQRYENEHCVEGTCDTSGGAQYVKSRYNLAVKQNGNARLFGIIGAGLAVAGGVLLFTRTSEDTDSGWIAPVIGPGSLGVVGTF